MENFNIDTFGGGGGGETMFTNPDNTKVYIQLSVTEFTMRLNGLKLETDPFAQCID